MPITLKIKQMHSGGNHSAILYRDVNNVELGVAVWDPARGQFAFSPFDNDLVLSSSDQTTIVNLLNGLGR